MRSESGSTLHLSYTLIVNSALLDNSHLATLEYDKKCEELTHRAHASRANSRETKAPAQRLLRMVKDRTQPMKQLKEEITRTKSQIETTRQQLDGMLNDHSIPLWKPIETNRSLKELVAYLKGLEYQTDC
jgi:predicted  nucleic acid-binding Zn-ribbon protein